MSIAAGLVICNQFLPEDPRDEIINEGLEIIVESEQPRQGYEPKFYDFFDKDSISDMVRDAGKAYVEDHDKSQREMIERWKQQGVEEYLAKLKKDKG